MLLPRDDQARDVASDSGPFGGPEFRPVSRPFVASQRWSGPVAMIALLAGESSIRDAMAFPKTAAAEDLMAGAPSPVDAKQLRDLHLRAGK